MAIKIGARSAGLSLEQQREKLAAHLLAFRDDRNAFEQRFIRIGHHAVEKYVDNGSASSPGRAIRAGAVHGSRMVKRTLPLFLSYAQGLEFFLQCLGGLARALP